MTRTSYHSLIVVDAVGQARFATEVNLQKGCYQAALTKALKKTLLL